MMGRMIPAVLVTGDTNFDDEQLDIGHAQLMTKPLHVSRLLAETQRLLSAVKPQVPSINRVTFTQKFVDTARPARGRSNEFD